MPGCGSLYKRGYTFRGWKHGGSGWVYSVGEYTRVTSNFTVYPVWQPYATYYRVNYYAGSTYGADLGNLPADGASYQAGETVTIKAAPTYKDQVFLGWNTKENGAGTRYKPGSTLTMGMGDVN